MMKVSQNRILRRIPDSKRKEVAVGWRRLHNEELHNLYTLPDIIRTINSRRTKPATHHTWER
jgi:hypothetical protein